MMDMRKLRIAALLVLASSAAFAAEPPSAQAESPAVSGEELENMNRNTETPTAPQAGARPAESAPPSAPAPNAQSQATPRGRNDRLELDTTVVTGNRELPKVLYIVPWKKAEIGVLPAQPFNTLLDEVLTPVDRDVFRREVTYYDAVNAGGPAADDSTAPPSKAQ